MKELIQRIMARPLLAVELLAASLFANLLGLASSIFVILVLNRYVAHGVDATLVTLTGGVVLAIIFEFAFRRLRHQLAEAVGSKPDRELSLAAFSTMTGARAAAIESLPHGLRREVMVAAETVQSAYSPANVTAVLDIPFALIFVAAVTLLSPLLGGVVVCFLIGTFIAATWFQGTLRRPMRDLAALGSRKSGLLGTVISAADTVRAFGLGGWLRKAWEEEEKGQQSLKQRVGGRQATLQAAIQAAQGLMTVMVIAIAAKLVVAGEMDVGAMIGANILAVRALGPIIKFAAMGEVLAKGRQAQATLANFLRLPREKTEGAALETYKGRLELKDMAFGWPGSRGPLFESLSLKLEPGSVLVVLGANGAGKTTLARLIVGLIDPTRGHVLADGMDLAQASPEWWRRMVAYMPQEPRFLNASIRENLLAANPELDDAGLTRLIGMAGLRNFIERNPQGLELKLIDGGDNLSLGIRRRLTLARALAHDGKLAVFDEPTEGLDAEGAAHVYGVMNDMARGGRTIVAFSHDPNILKGASLILDLDAKPVPQLRDGGKS